MAKKAASGLLTPPRRYVNMAVLVGGGIGFFWQDRMNLDNSAAFALTAVCCLVAVAVLNFAWLYKVRRGGA
jgi:dolichyl-phosphate-mannose--protein O-mannosyl transferase